MKMVNQMKRSFKLMAIFLILVFFGLQSVVAAAQDTNLSNVKDNAKETLNNASETANQTADEVQSFLDPIQDILNSINNIVQQIQQIFYALGGGQ